MSISGPCVYRDSNSIWPLKEPTREWRAVIGIAASCCWINSLLTACRYVTCATYRVMHVSRNRRWISSIAAVSWDPRIKSQNLQVSKEPDIFIVSDRNSCSYLTLFTFRRWVERINSKGLQRRVFDIFEIDAAGKKITLAIKSRVVTKRRRARAHFRLVSRPVHRRQTFLIAASYKILSSFSCT